MTQPVFTRLKASYGDAILKGRGVDIERLPSGISVLDRILNGGYPRGRLIEVYGPPSSGKTTLALYAMISAQKSGGNVVFVDTEFGVSLPYAEQLGLDISRLIVVRPADAEQALEIIRTLISTRMIALIVIDSLAALVPRAHLRRALGVPPQRGLSSTLAQMLPTIVHLLGQTACTLFCTNQTRTRFARGLGGESFSVGGISVAFAAAVRLETVVLGSLHYGGDNVGVRVGVRVVKNRFAPPYRTATLNFFHEGDLGWAAHLILELIESKVLHVDEEKIIFQSEEIGHGIEEVVFRLREDEMLLRRLLRAS